MSNSSAERESVPEKPEDAPVDEPQADASGEPAGPETDGAPGAESSDAAELTAARAALEEQRELHLRAVAEIDNLRKRSAREIDNARRFAIERFASELLAVIDSLEMGLASGASAEALLEGSEATLRLLTSSLEKAGVEVVDPEGQNFDPELHEAMTMQPSETAEPGSVLTVIQKGYTLNGRLLRPARVVVAAEPPPPSDADESDSTDS